MTNFRIYTDGILYGISRTEEEPDGIEVFDRFHRAKIALVRKLRSSREQYAAAVKAARLMKLSDVEDE